MNRGNLLRFLLLCLLLALSLAMTVHRALASGSNAVLVSGREYTLSLSRPSVTAGKLRVEFDNFGEDDHDLAILRRSTGKVYKLPVVHPCDRAVINVPARRGSYVLWCTISNHKAKGMRAVLRVKR